MDSILHLYNLLGPQSWEEMRPYRNVKLPAPSTVCSADRLTAIGLVALVGALVHVAAAEAAAERVPRKGGLEEGVRYDDFHANDGNKI